MTLADDEIESIFYLEVAAPLPDPGDNCGRRAMKQLHINVIGLILVLFPVKLCCETMHFLGFNFLVIDHNRYSFW